MRAKEAKLDELAKLVAERTGIPEELAAKAAETVIDFLKEKLPAPIAAQIDGILDNPNVASQAGDLLSGLGGLLGKK